MTDKATTPSDENAVKANVQAHQHSPEQLSRRSSVREARTVLSQGGLGVAFGGDRKTPDPEQLIDLAEYLDSGNILIRDLDDEQRQVVRAFGTNPIAGVAAEPDLAEEPEPTSLSDLFKKLEPKPVLKIDVEQLAKMSDEGVDAFIKESRRLIKHGLRGRIEQARKALAEPAETEAEADRG